MSATDYLSAIKWGTGNGKETTSTIGTARVDVREPPSVNHISGLQITRYGEVLLAMTDYFAGGQRVRMLATTSNQFGVGEYGVHVFSDGAVDNRIKAQLKLNNVDTYVDVPAAAVTTKGDILAFSGTRWVKLAAGTNGHSLVADSGATSGLAWSAAPSGILAANNTWTGTNAFNGSATDIGDSATDTLSVAASIDTDLTFIKEVNRVVSVAASTTAATAGASLTVRSGNGNGAAGGAMTLDTGSGSAGGTLSLGTTNAAVVAIGHAAAVVVLAGDVQIDSATFSGDALWAGAGDVLLSIDTAESAGNGNTLMVRAGAALTAGNGGDLDLRAGAGTGGGTNGVVKVGMGTTLSVQLGGTNLGFYGGAVTAKYATTGTTGVTVAGAGTALRDDTTVTGGTGATAYTFPDIVRALKLLNLVTP